MNFNGFNNPMLSLCLLLLAFAAPAAALVIDVDPGDSIQAALDTTAPGDTVSVAAGVFVEQLRITTEDITLIGAGIDSTFIQSPPELSESFYTVADNYPVVFIDNVTTAEVAELTVDGDEKGVDNVRFLGVAFWNSGGVLHDVRVTRITEYPLGTLFHGVGVYAYNDDGMPRDITIERVAVDRFQRAGVSLGGPGLSVTAADVEISGFGPNQLMAQNGVQISHGASAVLSGFTISDIVYTDEVGTASGVLIYQANSALLSDFHIMNCQNSVYFNDSSGSFSGGLIENPIDNGINLFRTSTPSLAESDSPPPPPNAQDFPLPIPSVEMPYSAIQSPLMSVIISDSEFSGAGSDWGVACLPQGDMDITMTGCGISGWDTGFGVLDRGGSLSGVVTGNSFTSCVRNVGSNMDAIVDASGNWHGVSAAELVAAAVDTLVDYSPWLAIGADTSPDIGFQGDYTHLIIDDDSPVGESGTPLAEAIALTTGGLIEVLPGTYSETGQLVIDHDVEIAGDQADKPLIVAGTDTGLAGDDAGWLLIPAGSTVDLHDMTLDGTGRLIEQAVRFNGGGNVTRCDFIDIQRSCLAVAGDAAVVARDSDFGESGVYGVENTGSVVVDARQNWWGSFTGPYHPTLNATGLGTDVTDDVLFDPWIGMSSVVAEPAATDTVLCTGSITVDFSYAPWDTTPPVGGYAVTVAASPELDFGAADIFDSGVLGSFGEHDFQVVDNGDGTFTISDSLIDPEIGLDAGAHLFSVTFHGSTEGVGAVTMPSVLLSGLSGGSFGAFGYGCDIFVVCDSDPYRAGLSISPVHAGPIDCVSTVNIGLHYAPGDSTPALRGYEMTIAVSPELRFAGEDIVDAGSLSAVGGNFFRVLDNNDGTFTILDAILGDTPGLVDSAILANITIHPAANGVGDVSILSFKLRGLDNAPIAALTSDATVQVECVTGIAPAPLAVLDQNHPNPFNPRTSIGFSLERPGRVLLTVHSVDGRLIDTLVDERLDEGRHSAVWNGVSASGVRVGAGVYLYRMVTGNKVETRKMVLLK